MSNKKSTMTKFTLKNFQQMFPDDDACLDHMRTEWFPEVIKCETCGRNESCYRIAKRKVYSCNTCGWQFSPAAGTIFHKSPTPLTIWFYVIYLMAQTRGGISAKQIQRETGVTYKTAWRMCKQVRSMLGEDFAKFDGEVEVDESYFGGEVHDGTRGRGASNKTAGFGMGQSGGELGSRTGDNVKRNTIMTILAYNVVPRTQRFNGE